MKTFSVPLVCVLLAATLSACVPISKLSQGNSHEASITEETKGPKLCNDGEFKRSLDCTFGQSSYYVDTSRGGEEVKFRFKVSEPEEFVPSAAATYSRGFGASEEVTPYNVKVKITVETIEIGGEHIGNFTIDPSGGDIYESSIRDMGDKGIEMYPSRPEPGQKETYTMAWNLDDPYDPETFEIEIRVDGLGGGTHTFSFNGQD